MKKHVMNNSMQEGIALLLLSGWLLWYSLDAYRTSYIKDWAQSPSLFPIIVSGLLALFGVIILCQGVQERDAQREKAGGKTLQVCIVLGMSLAYYLALSVVELPYLGMTVGGLTFSFSTFEAATAVFLFVMMFCLGVRAKAVLIGVPVGATAFLSVMFRTLLRVLLP